jgi:hypothetical protein
MSGRTLTANVCPAESVCVSVGAEPSLGQNSFSKRTTTLDPRRWRSSMGAAACELAPSVPAMPSAQLVEFIEN